MQRFDAAPRFDGLHRFNTASREQVLAELTACCASPGWAQAVADGRPYPSVDTVLEQADSILGRLDEAEIDKALAAHPRIGERPDASPEHLSPEHPSAQHLSPEHASSRREQAGVVGADAEVLAALAEGNRFYEQRFGYVYLVCADGRSATELLALLRGRLANDPSTERWKLRSELAKINKLRLTRLLEQP